MPLYTWRESAEITSPLSARARAAASLVFPDAVGPQTTIIFFSMSVMDVNLPLF
jgi:hypothetical protein